MRGGEDEQCQGKGIQKGMKLFVSINNTGETLRISQSQENSAFRIKKVSVWKIRDRWKEAVNGDDTSRGKADIRNEGLNERQRLFCIYYVKSFNATQAAVKAGYSPASAHVTGCRLLKTKGGR